MLLPAPPLYPRKRKPKAKAVIAPPVPAALQVIGVENVVYDEPLLTFTLVFNTTAENPLVVDAPDPAKWSAVYQGGGFFCESVAFAGFDRLDVQMNGTPGPGG